MKAEALTEQAFDVLEALCDLHRHWEMPPSTHRIAQRSGYRQSTVIYYLRRMTEQGLVKSVGERTALRYFPTFKGKPDFAVLSTLVSLRNAIQGLDQHPELRAKVDSLRAEIERAIA